MYKMKRSEKFDYKNIAKKAKFNEQPTDDIWGDDPEVEEFDKCIEVASQLCSQKSVNDVEAVSTSLSMSISYDNFKTKPNMFTSTQKFIAPTPLKNKHENYQRQLNLLNSSVSSVNTVINKDVSPEQYQQQLLEEIQKLKVQNTKLTEKTETKDGEISILRAQLKQSQKAVDTEKMQKLCLLERNQQHANDKMNTLTKELEGYKSQLDLKNLCIANLKEKVGEVSRIHNNGNTMDLISLFGDNNLSQTFRRKNLVDGESPSKIIKPTNNITVQTLNSMSSVPLAKNLYYPLQHYIPKSLFQRCKCKDNAIVKLKSSNNSKHISRHNSRQLGNVIIFKPPECNNEVLSAEYFFPELVILMKSTDEELNSTKSTAYINKIIYVTREILISTVKYLEKIDQSMGYEDILDMDAQYLQSKNCDEGPFCIFDRTPWCENEVGIELRRCLSIMAVLVIHNSYLLNSIIGNCHFLLSEDYIFTPYTRNSTSSDSSSNTADEKMCVDQPHNEDLPINKCDILDIILDATRIIGKVRRSHQFPGFLSSVLNLLTSLFYEKELPTQCYSLVHSIYKEITFSRPNKSVLIHILTFLRNISFHYQMINLFCKNSTLATFKANARRDCFSFTEDTCTFQITAMLLEGNERNVNLACDIIKFLYNSLKYDAFWMYSQGNERCECLFKVYTISIEVLYELIKDYLVMKQTMDENMLKMYHNTFNVGLLLIHLLTVRSPDLIIRCLTLYSQYQEWIKNVKTIADDLNLNQNHYVALETLVLNISNETTSSTASQDYISNTLITQSFFEFNELVKYET